jgi:hypothetical protein
MTCMTCRYRYDVTFTKTMYMGCLVNNGCGPVLISVVREHLVSETKRLGRLPTFGEVEGCPAHEEGDPMYVEGGGSHG